MYSTLDDIKKVIPEEVMVQATDDENLGSVNQDRVDEAIAAADAKIDSYCGGRYRVPLSTVPEIVKALSVDIAVYNLYSRTQFMPEVRKDRYRDAIKQLEGIARGLVSLGVAEAPPAADPGSGAETNKPTDSNVFSRSKMEGF